MPTSPCHGVTSNSGTAELKRAYLEQVKRRRQSGSQSLAKCGENSTFIFSTTEKVLMSKDIEFEFAVGIIRIPIVVHVGAAFDCARSMKRTLC